MPETHASSTFRPEPGARVLYGGQPCLVLRQLSLTSVLIEDVRTEERRQAQLGDLSPWQGDQPDEKCRKTPDLATIQPEKREIGLKRLEVIKGLLGLKYRTRQDVKNAGEQLGLSTSQTYSLMNRLANEGTWTCLAPHVEKGKPRKKRISALAESLIQEAIDQTYMGRHNAPKAEVIRAAKRLCRQAGISAPAPNSIVSRIEARDPRSVLEARRGKKAARDKFDPVLGPMDEARWPLQSVQIDHTVADFFVVDEQTNLPIARPILTLAIDEFSRAVLGFHLSLRAPSTLSVALTLIHSVLLKDSFCQKHGIGTWPMYGLPDQILTDSAVEFDSRGLIAGCAQYRINGVFRPLGRPHFGGRIERLIGTLMGRAKLMPGATMRSVAERGDEYDPEKEAAYTLSEAETRIALEIGDIYHRSVHSAIGTTPEKLWEFGILGDDKIPGRGIPALPSDPHRFLLDFLPLEQRTVQEYGLQIGYLRYHSPVLRAFLTGKRAERQYIVRYDPRDMSQVYFYDPDAGEYHTIPRANSHYPPCALWEVKDAIKHLKAEGRDPNDEQAVNLAIERIRRMDEDAVLRSKRSRRNAEMRRQDARGHQQFSTLSTPTIASPTDAGEPPAATSPRPRIRPISDVEGW